MTARFTMVNGGDSIIIEYLATIDRGINQPVIATFHPIIYRTFEIG
jgi:hypothetical protein